MYPWLIAIIVLLVYLLAYTFYGKKLLAQRIVKVDPNRPTPAVTKFDGVDYVPANKYILYGHHFATIAAAGPIVGPATALVWGWLIPIVWIIAGNVFLGSVHDYLSLMSSVRHGGITIMSLAENIMGKKARYAFLIYVFFTGILLAASFFSIVASVFESVPTAATINIMYMPLALLFGLMVYRYGMSVKKATVIALILLGIIFAYSYYSPIYATYEAWIFVATIYCIVAGSLPVWYLLQPRDYLNSYFLWTTVALAVIAPFFLPYRLTGPAISTLVAKGSVIGGVAGTPAATFDIAWIWPSIVLVVACGALSGAHAVSASGLTSKQLANELDGLFVGYGGMLTEGALSALAVITPAALAWNFVEAAAQAGISAELVLAAGINVTRTPTILQFPAVNRYYVGYGFAQALAWSRFLGPASFPDLYKFFSSWAAWSLTAFIMTSIDSGTRVRRFMLAELLEPIKPKAPSVYKFLTNRWIASTLVTILVVVMAIPKIPDPANPAVTIYAYTVTWPASSGNNQLQASLALMIASMWVLVIQKIRGPPLALILVPALFLWVTVTSAFFLWYIYIMPYLPLLYLVTTAPIMLCAGGINFYLLFSFISQWRRARQEQ
ncbi:MAG: carbon starvation protein A [Desulfurococcaceae archaeon]